MPFKRIISRDNGVPWGETGMTSKKWLKVETESIPVSMLIATQPGVLLHALSEEYSGEPIGGDKHPHVIYWRGEYYLEDGHHRVLRAMLRGEKSVEVRVLTAPRRPAKMKTSEPDTRLRKSIRDMSPEEREAFRERLKDLRKKLMEDAERLPNGI